MINTAVICEYNPFHNGHIAQLRMIRERFGGDAVITAVMSGDFTQRGSFAVLPKYERARLAVDNGCDLVLELPFPWSCAGADIFARAGVAIAAAAIGVNGGDVGNGGDVDNAGYLCFGSETRAVLGEAETVAAIREYNSRKAELAAERGVRPERTALRSGLRADEARYRERYGETAFYPSKANDILACEYCAAAAAAAVSSITGAADTGEIVAGTADAGTAEYGLRLCPLPRVSGYSATEARRAMAGGRPDGETLMPPDTLDAVKRLGGYADEANTGAVIPAFFRLAEPEALRWYCGAGGGMAERLCAAAGNAVTAGELYRLCASKNYTAARIRRAALSCMFGVTREALRAAPPFTLLLAANTRGLARLKAIASIPVITKPSDYVKCGDNVKAAFKNELRAEKIYALALPDGGKSYNPLRQTPYIRS